MDPRFLSASDSLESYYDPRLAASLNSMEGVPDWPSVAETEEERRRRATLQHRAHQVFQWIGTLLPGVTLAALLAIAGREIAHWLGVDVLRFAQTPISEITIATLLGLAIRNAIGLPQVYESGLRVCLRWILRGGIVLLGLRLSLVELRSISVIGVPLVALCIVASLALVTAINRLLGVPRRLGSLIAVGTSICGVSAIVATGPVIEAEDDEVSYAVACVTIFGMIALFCYPLLAHFVFAGDAVQAGLFLGTSIHDTAQVAGAGRMYEQQYAAPDALNTATVTKLFRNVSMALVIPLVGIAYHRRSPREGAKRRKLLDLVPLFVVGFLIMTVVRSLGDLGSQPFGVLELDQWRRLLAAANVASLWCLAMAMTAVGLGTSFKKLAHVGLQPFVAGLTAALSVGLISFALIKTLSPLLGP
jgi:uncharacterized integral membrane protein (TIGR00698 family)